MNSAVSSKSAGHKDIVIKNKKMLLLLDFSCFFKLKKHEKSFVSHPFSPCPPLFP